MITMIYTSDLPTVQSADSTDLNEAVTKSCLRNEIAGYVEKLCTDLLHLLKLCALKIDRTSLVEKCCTLYYTLINIKFEGNWPSI